MFVQFTGTGHRETFERFGSTADAIAQSGQLDALVAFEGIGSRRSFARNEEIFAEGDPADCWFKVISGTVRVCKLLADGRRHIADFFFSGDSFGLHNLPERLFSAEAVGDVVVIRYSRRATERLIDKSPHLALGLSDMTLRDLANAQIRMLMLGRMSAPERVANFLLDMFERRDATRAIDLPMSRNDIADYLGLTIETVCRVMSMFKRDGIIGNSDAAPDRVAQPRSSGGHWRSLSRTSRIRGHTTRFRGNAGGWRAFVQVSNAPPIAGSDCGFASGRLVTLEDDQSDIRGPVCIVGDDDWVCDSLSVLLETYGFAALAYASGAEFLGDDEHRNAKCLIIDQHVLGIAGTWPAPPEGIVPYPPALIYVKGTAAEDCSYSISPTSPLDGASPCKPLSCSPG
jgi:CRP/FNR family transcriptional regulator, nitrogen fixation regulation protein